MLWEHGHATVADVVDALLPPPLAYTTVLSTLRTREQKGYVAHEEDGRAFVYHPLVARERAAKSAIEHLLARFFKNSPGDFAVALLDDTRLSDADVAKIKRLLGPRKGTS